MEKPKDNLSRLPSYQTGEPSVPVAEKHDEVDPPKASPGGNFVSLVIAPFLDMLFRAFK
jgi:hypothetical protein